MPELPEVQAVVDYLTPRIIGEKIKETSVFWARTIATHSPAQFKKLLAGSSVKVVQRRGKFIIIHLQSKPVRFLLIHLRMTGTVDVLSKVDLPGKHDRVILHFASGKRLIFNDTRKFGKIYLTDDLELATKHLGQEPLDPNLNVEALAKLLKKRRTMIKPLLLNQRVLVGVGNIYADEALWKAKIHPRTAANKVPKIQLERLIIAIREILQEAISLSGTDFGDGVVEGGMYTPKVYGRTGKKCPRCPNKLSKTVVGQRGTHFCRSCQPRIY